jgi:hypothetical protein
MGDWLQDYGWVIPAFAMGVPLGLVLADNPDRLEVFSYLGTFGAAIAAFWAVFLNQRAQQQRARQEAEAQRPYLLVSRANCFNEKAKIAFTNLSQHPAHIRDVIVVSDDEAIPGLIPVGLLVPPGKTTTYTTAWHVHFVEEGNLRFFFHYASTGPLLHRIVLPFIFLSTEDKKWNPTQVAFLLSEQTLKENVPDEREEVYRYINEMNMHSQSEKRSSDEG